MNKINIAVDGHSSCGKSTLAKSLAKSLNYIYVDSGAMYRAVTLYAIQKELISTDFIQTKPLLSQLHLIRITFDTSTSNQQTYLNGVNVERKIRDQSVASLVSQIASIKEVREYLVAMQQEMGNRKGVVMDGRDIGTVVFPNAELKLFVTANAKVRAERRYKEMIQNGYENVDFDTVLNNIQERDYIDTHRAVSPLTKAKDAIIIDTTNHTRESQLEFVLKLAQKTIHNQK